MAYLQSKWFVTISIEENVQSLLTIIATTLVELFPKNSTKEQITNPQFNDRYC